MKFLTCANNTMTGPGLKTQSLSFEAQQTNQTQEVQDWHLFVALRLAYKLGDMNNILLFLGI